MAGSRALTKIQLGRESTAGTAVAATTLWRGMGTIHDTREAQLVSEDVGILMGTHRSIIPNYEAAISMASVNGNFQQILHLLEAGIMTATPADDGVGSGKIYTYNFPTTAAPTIKTYTIEGGDNQQAEEMEYSFVESFSLSGTNREGLMMAGEWKGRQVTNSTFTGALAVPAVEDILAQKGKLYINAVSSAFGTTPITGTLLSMEFSYTTGIIPKYTIDTGNLYFAFHQFTKPEARLNLVFEHDSVAVAEKTAFRAETPRAIQLKFEGSALTTPGTTYTYHTLILNLPGKYTKFEALSEQDGNNTYAAEFAIGYDSTLATAGQIIVVNQLASVP